MKKEEMYLYNKCVPIFIFISCIFTTITVGMNSLLVEGLMDIKRLEIIVTSFLQLLITINMIKAFHKDDEMQIVLTIKYFSILTVLHMFIYLFML